MTIVHKDITTDSIKVEIQRDIKTGDGGNDFDVNSEINNVIYSYTDEETPEKHTNTYGYVAVDFSKTDGGIIERSRWGDGTFMWHQHGMAIIWTIICDVLIFIGKYLKKYKRWFDIHAWSFLVLGICSWILTQSAPETDRRRLLTIRDLAEGEINVMESWAKPGLHESSATIGNLLTVVLIFQGLVLRFVIALDKRYKFLP